MASGDLVVHVLDILPPGSAAATPDERVSGNSPTIVTPVWDFDGGSTIEYLDFLCYLSGYANGGLTFTIAWTPTTTGTSGTVRWEIAIKSLTADADDLDANLTFSGFNGVSSDEPSAAGEPIYATVTFDDGADMDSWANGELAIVRVRRDPTHGDDDLTSIDAELIALVGKET